MVFPLGLREFLQKALPDGLTLSVILPIFMRSCFHKTPLTTILPHKHFYFKICHLIMLQGIGLFNLEPVRNVQLLLPPYITVKAFQHHDGINIVQISTVLYARAQDSGRAMQSNNARIFGFLMASGGKKSVYHTHAHLLTTQCLAFITSNINNRLAW